MASLQTKKAVCYGRSVEDGWSHRLAWPRTEPSQGLNTGSNPVGTTTLSLHLFSTLAPSARGHLGAESRLIRDARVPQILSAELTGSRQTGKCSTDLKRTRAFEAITTCRVVSLSLANPDGTEKFICIGRSFNAWLCGNRLT